jgi:hypothetical protein
MKRATAGDRLYESGSETQPLLQTLQTTIANKIAGLSL